LEENKYQTRILFNLYILVYTFTKLTFNLFWYHFLSVNLKFVINRYHNTSSVTDMLQTLTWPSLQQRRLKTKLIMFYKIVHHIVAVPTTILIPTDPRIRQCHPFTYRHLHAFKDSYKYSFFPNTIIHWNLLPQTIVLCPTVNTFREQLTPTVLSHLQLQI
jgi:hypothetical protein